MAKLEATHADHLQSQLEAQHLEHRRQLCELRDRLQLVAPILLFKLFNSEICILSFEPSFMSYIL